MGKKTYGYLERLHMVTDTGEMSGDGWVDYVLQDQDHRQQHMQAAIQPASHSSATSVTNSSATLLGSSKLSGHIQG